MEDLEWREDADGGFVVDTTRFRLIVRQVANCRYAQYLVLAKHGSTANRRVGSGTAITAAQGMNDARNMAERFLDGSAFAGPLVMVVDDNSSVCDTSADVLLDAGYQVTKAASGEVALHRLEQTTCPAVLVSDIDLGDGMNGLELAATIHKLWPGMGVLLVSASDELAACEGVQEEFLAKPFSIDQLLDRVAAIAARMDHPPQSARS